MHLPENYLSPATCLAMTTAMAPVWHVTLKKLKIQIKEKPETVPMIGVGAALSFLIMMFNFPVPGGTTAHAIGGTLLAILIGPNAACLAISITLLVQAVLFGDGGLLAFGANAFNMAFVMPFSGYYIYSFFAKHRHGKFGAALGSYLGIVLAALLTGVELGIQPLLFRTATGIPRYFPYGLNVTLPAMTSVHLLVVGFVEALLTVAVYAFVHKTAHEELYGYRQVQSRYTQGFLQRSLIFLLAVLAICTPLGLLSSNSAWGEWTETELLQQLQTKGISQQLPHGMQNGFDYHALFADYQITALPAGISYLLIALTVFVVILILIKVCRHEPVQ